VPVFDVRLGYTPADLQQAFHRLTPAQRNVIAWGHLTADALYPLVYAITLSVFLLAALGGTPSARARRVLALPWLALAADYGENLCLAALLWAYPRPLPFLAALAPWLTALKWGAILLSVAAILFFGGRGFRQRPPAR